MDRGKRPWRNRGNPRNQWRGRGGPENDHSGEGAGPSDHQRGSWRSNHNSRANHNNWNRTQSETRPRQNDEGQRSATPQHPRPMGFKILEDLTKKNIEDLVLDLQNSRKGFVDVLNTKLPNDFVILIIKILRKVCDSNFEEVKHTILQKSFLSSFKESLKVYICTLPSQRAQEKRFNSHFWRDPDEFWNNLIKICDDMINLIPTFACVHLDGILDALKIYIPIFEAQHNQHISDEIKNQIAKQIEIVEDKKKELEEKHVETVKQKMNYDQEEGPPPDDFREISVYPRPDEIIGGRGYLRCNVVQGPYTDVHHYLDVQFRLLREDFVGPLRDGISEFRSGSKKRIEGVRIHKRIRFLCSETVNEKFCRRIKYDWSVKKKSFKYENSRRFMFGSLLCFTYDKFKTLIFGKVAEREEKDLENGELIVGFDKDIPVLYDVDYLMVECSVYFEPYYHVLNVLKKMSPENFPMERYIINVSSEVHAPEYILNEPQCRYNIQGRVFSPLQAWPDHANFYGFNDSQRAAFKAAVTQEFAIIQGPPGTGKTFLGLKIAKTLLENKDYWYDKTPMLVICYTNHALDQFLEGITEFTHKIVRVGGQSQNEKLKPFNLRSKGRRMKPAVFQQRAEVQNILKKIKNVTEDINQINFYHSIRDFSVFGDFVKNFDDSWFATAKRHEILDWLLEGALTEQEHPELVEVQNQFNQIMIDGDHGDEETENQLPENIEEDDDAAGDANVDERQRNPVDDIFQEVFDDVLADVQCSFPLLTFTQMEKDMQNLKQRLWDVSQLEFKTFDDLVEGEKCRLDLERLYKQYNYLKEKLFLARQTQNLPKVMPPNVNLKDPKQMKYEDRWQLYFYWLDQYKELLKRKYTQLNDDFRATFKIYEDLRDIEDTTAMKEGLVVGMTTTGAARLRQTLQALKSPIVIVEEAAEVLEAHIVTSLTRHCQHLILIGDHQQLKPSTSNFKVETFFKLGISLFERMVINKIQCYTLNVQHRMRPEISCLITPTIYPNLEDHESVLDRPNIRGVEKSVFFLDHKHKEDNCEGTSKKNRHEVDFLINFAKHLILNGYEAKDITILAAYLGQMFEMQRARRAEKALLENVRISVLDNYQGEECDIILLSLVRSNEEGKIGFLSIENRVCVALSRARNGFYIMGNMTQLTDKTKLWRQIKTTLEHQGSFGTELVLRCQVHPDRLTYVKCADDFYRIPEGGCDQKCDAALACGHNCTSLCHTLDRDHNSYKCREVCGKKLCDKDELHICEKQCYKECGDCTYLVPTTLKCGHHQNIMCHVDVDTYQCTVPVACILPCGHEVADKPCHRDPETFKCPHPCDSRIEPCGHECLLPCHVRKDPDHLQYKCFKPCARYREGCTVQTAQHICQKRCYEKCDKCGIVVQKHRTVCPHVYKIACHEDVDDLECERPCAKVLPCGHKCRTKCCEPCTTKCEVKMEKINDVCKHSIKVKCFQEPDRKLCEKKCPLQLPCGHPCTKKCKEPCTPVCQVIVDCLLHSPCGHLVTKIKCGVNDAAKIDPEQLLKYCNAPCEQTLKCEHKCSGNCGACSQGRIHQRCEEKCGIPLVCNHECKFPCRTACRPCGLPCTYQCKHSRCRKKCGDVCTPCKEKCPRRCPHQKCPKYCGEICEIPPCSEPCPELLRCGHPCIGFCGDPCPSKCLTCDKQELLETEMFFGTEDEDSRFVLLEDCGHVLENTGVEYWLKQSDNEISLKVCPKCKAPIKTTERYSHLVKQAMADVVAVKLKFHGIPAENEKQRKELEVKVVQLRIKVASFAYSAPLARVIQILLDRLKISKGGKRQFVNKYELHAVATKCQIIQHILDICSSTKSIGPLLEAQKEAVAFIAAVLRRDDDYITNQEAEDIGPELSRLTRIMQLGQIQEKVGANSNDKIKELQTKIGLILFKHARYDDADDAKLKDLLTELSTVSQSGIGISEKEKKEILQAMKLNKGHWFRCPNGHIYCITECGGAMITSRCSECGAMIGGGNHQLLANNTLASEMDGAAHAAWSEAANLQNYDLNDLNRVFNRM